MTGIWEILRELLPLIIALIKAIKGSENKPQAIRDIKEQCMGVGCAPETKKD